jgi:hypothetical protein
MTPSAQPAGPAVITDVAVEQKLLQDGEIIILSIRPSPWYVLIVSAPVVALAGVVIGAIMIGRALGEWEGHRMAYWIALAVAVLRLAVACAQCMGIRYVLTNHRVLRLRTLLTTTVYELPLGEIARARVSASAADRLVGVGEIVFESNGQRAFEGVWTCVADPASVAETVNQTIHRYDH